LNPYFRLKTGDGVFVLALTPKNEVILVRQYRPAIDAWTFEMPAGGVEKSQSPLEAARRELWEEAGYVSNDWRRLGGGRIMMNRSSGRMHGWLALGAKLRARSSREERLPVTKVKLSQFSDWMVRHKFEQIGGLGFLLQGLVRYPKELEKFFLRDE
jgi:predicted NUDIX family NTP pyrophosphohydrolase